MNEKMHQIDKVVEAKDQRIAELELWLKTANETADFNNQKFVSRIELLEKVLVNARACLNAVIGSKEQWTLEQERIGNKAICLISLKEIEQALSQKGG